ncbi:MAG: hypothetical protein ACRDPY_22130 [Streptosporangiaceae bacterium]
MITITICKAVLSGAAPGRVREQVSGLAPAGLRDLAVRLAGEPELTVSVITYQDGRQELEVLPTGPPHLSEHTIDRNHCARQPEYGATRTVSVATPGGLQDAIALVRGILLDPAAR